eukprot:6945070-Pyramimonas_sp.AAC.1
MEKEAAVHVRARMIENDLPPSNGPSGGGDGLSDDASDDEPEYPSLLRMGKIGGRVVAAAGAAWRPPDGGRGDSAR